MHRQCQVCHLHIPVEICTLLIHLLWVWAILDNHPLRWLILTLTKWCNLHHRCHNIRCNQAWPRSSHRWWAWACNSLPCWQCPWITSNLCSHSQCSHSLLRDRWPWPSLRMAWQHHNSHSSPWWCQMGSMDSSQECLCNSHMETGRWLWCSQMVVRNTITSHTEAINLSLEKKKSNNGIYTLYYLCIFIDAWGFGVLGFWVMWGCYSDYKWF